MPDLLNKTMSQIPLTPHMPVVETLAQAWLKDGAIQFVLQVDGQPPARWPQAILFSREQIRAPLTIGGRTTGELRVLGASSTVAQQRLRAEARLLSSLFSSEKHLEQMTEELVNTQDQLLALYELTEASRRQLTLDKLLMALISRTNQLLQTKRAFVIFQPPDQAPILYQYPTDSIPRHLLRYYLTLIQEEQKPTILRSHHPKNGAPDWKSLMLLPILVQNQVMGGIGLIDKRAGTFTASDLKLGQAVAEQTAAHIENHLLYQQQMVRTRLETEMKLAQHVHTRLLPNQIPSVPGLDIWAGCRTASQVGGDFYDFLHHPTGKLTMTVGDISGKGMPAAMLMTMTRTVLRSQSNHHPPPTPQEIIDRSNNTLYTDFNDVNMFATVFITHYTPEERLLTYANAGHSPVIYCPAGGRAKLLEADGMPIGILPHSISTDQRLNFHPGDLLIVATDGFSEAENQAEVQFGHDRLLAVAQALASAEDSARAIVSRLYRLVEDHSGSTARSDDQTVVVLKAI